MQWKDDYCIGITAIDDQHRQIFSHLLSIENALDKRDPWHIVRFLFAQLSDYLKFHFAVEEAMLEIVHYPTSDHHRAAHGQLVQQLATLETAVKESGSDKQLVEFFESWFVQHVLSSDVHYAAYTREHFPVLVDKPPH